VSFDPSTIATQQAALVARCDYQQFTFTVTPSSQLRAGQSSIPFLGSSSMHPYQQFFTPTSDDVVAITFVAVYRGETYNGPPLMADASNQPVAQAAALTYANEFLNLIDLRASRDGANPNPYAPT
jgi:hypothetical protein